MKYIELNVKLQVTDEFEDRQHIVATVLEAIQQRGANATLTNPEEESSVVALVVTDKETGYYKGGTV